MRPTWETLRDLARAAKDGERWSEAAALYDGALELAKYQDGSAEAFVLMRAARDRCRALSEKAAEPKPRTAEDVAREMNERWPSCGLRWTADEKSTADTGKPTAHIVSGSVELWARDLGDGWSGGCDDGRVGVWSKKPDAESFCAALIASLREETDKHASLLADLRALSPGVDDEPDEDEIEGLRDDVERLKRERDEAIAVARDALGWMSLVDTISDSLDALSARLDAIATGQEPTP